MSTLLQFRAGQLAVHHHRWAGATGFCLASVACLLIAYGCAEAPSTQASSDATSAPSATAATAVKPPKPVVIYKSPNYDADMASVPKQAPMNPIKPAKSGQQSLPPDAGPQAADRVARFRSIGQALVKAHAHPDVTIVTNKGAFVVEIDPEHVEVNAGNFIALAASHFYNNLTFHRYVPGFVIQGGDPLGTGAGGPGYQIPNEDGPMLFDAGVLGMATSGPNTAGSQFFVTLDAAHHLDHQYTAFGKVVKGMDVVLNLRMGDTIKSMKVSGLPASVKLFNPVTRSR
jgi:cyclophilin family peptidyl-prolyl cis-trans isomerase